MKKICIFGKSSFLISNFLKEYSNQYIIDIYGRDNFDYSSKSFSYILKNNYDVILFAAAQSSAGLSWRTPQETLIDNINIFMNMACVIKDLKIDQKILYFSSAEVYGPSDKLLKETSKFNPINPYAVSKVALEHMVDIFKKEGLNVKIIRPFPIIGPGQKLSFAIPNFVNQVKEIIAGKRKPIIEHGNLDAQRDFTDIRYFSKVLKYLIDNYNDLKHNTYNICSGMSKTYTIKQILNLIISQSSISIATVLDEKRNRPNDLPFLCGDNYRITKETGVYNNYPIENTISYILNN